MHLKYHQFKKIHVQGASFKLKETKYLAIKDLNKKIQTNLKINS